MKTTRILVIVLILLSLIPQAFTASPEINPAAQQAILAHTPIRLVNLTIINNTGRILSMNLDGVSKVGEEKAYHFGPQYTGKAVYKLEMGTYVATFYGCGGEAAKKLQIQGNRNVTVKCAVKNDPTSHVTIQ